MQTLIYVGAWFAVCTVLAGWILLNRGGTIAWVLGIAAWVLSGLVGFLGLKSSPIGQLVWDGQHWHWESLAYQAGMAEYQVIVAADFQHVVLLHIRNHANASLWLWAERGTLPERWLDLRRAIYSPHRITTGQMAPA